MCVLPIEGRHPGTYEDFLDDSVRDPDAYGMTLEAATTQRDRHYLDQGQEIPPIPKLNENLFAKLPSLAQLEAGWKAPPAA